MAVKDNLKTGSGTKLKKCTLNLSSSSSNILISYVYYTSISDDGGVVGTEIYYSGGAYSATLTDVCCNSFVAVVLSGALSGYSKSTNVIEKRTSSAFFLYYLDTDNGDTASIAYR